VRSRAFLVVVDEDPVALLLPPLAGGEGRGRGARPRGPAPGPPAGPWFEAVLGDDPDVDVDAPRSRRLGIALEVHLLEHLPHHQAPPFECRRRGCRVRVEVEPAAHPDGRCRRSAPARGLMSMQPRVDRPDQRRQRVDDQQVGAAAARELPTVVVRRKPASPTGARFWKESTGRPPRWEALEDGGAVEAAGQGSRADREVVVDELALGDPAFGEGRACRRC